jgi:hypothetical protein
MKKSILILFIGMLFMPLFSQQDTTKTQPKDSITVKDIAKHRYLSTMDFIEYNQKCYKDSIPITEFYGKPIDGPWWKSKGRFYWDPFEQLPQNVQFLHWRPQWDEFIEFWSIKYRQQ